MLYFGFILNIILYALTASFFIGYTILFALRKNAILERFVNLLFLGLLLMLMGLSWTLIIMNGGFNVYLYIHIDYSYVLIIALPVIILYEVLDIFQRKKINKSDKWYVNLRRYLLPILSGILFFAITIIFYFNCNYFSFLK